MQVLHTHTPHTHCTPTAHTCTLRDTVHKPYQTHTSPRGTLVSGNNPGVHLSLGVGLSVEQISPEVFPSQKISIL